MKHFSFFHEMSSKAYVRWKNGPLFNKKWQASRILNEELFSSFLSFAIGENVQAEKYNWKSHGTSEFHQRVRRLAYSDVQLSFYSYYISPIEIGLLWAMITYLKSHSKASSFILRTDMKKIFQMRY